MIEVSPGVPPHIALLLNEEIDLSDFRHATRDLKGMLRDLKNQAKSLDYRPENDLIDGPREFRAVMNGGLDLFSNSGACQVLACRIGYADQIARSIALMSDKVSMHDYLCERILDLRSRPSNDEIKPLLADVVVLRRLKPLVEAGILRFSSPFVSTCSSCKQEFEGRVQQLAGRIFQSLGHKISVEREGAETSIDLGAIYDPGVIYQLSPVYAKKGDEELGRHFVSRAVRSALWDARTASSIQGSLFSNSRAAVAGLLSEDGNHLLPAEFQAFSAERAASLPWVSGLTIAQTLELRQEAHKALPALRQFMARRLSAASISQANADWRECVAELREQAEGVRSELALATSKSRSLHRNATGILGMTVSAVSLAAGGVIAGIEGLLSTLGLIHSIPLANSLHAETLRTKPGYVLVAAEDILHHAQRS